MTVPHLLFVIVINAIWGSMYVVAKFGLVEFPPVFFTSVRFALLAVILVPFIRVPRSMIWPLVKVGLVMGVGMYLTLYYAIYLSDNTGAVAVISQLEVPIAVILGALFLGETLNVERIGGVALAFAGALVIGFDPAMFDDLAAMFWMLVSAILFAVTMIMVRGMPMVHALTITAWLSIVSAPILFAVSVVFESGQWTAINNATWGGWGAILYTAIFGSVIAHSGMYYLLQRYPVGLIAPFTLLTPVFAIAGGVLFLGNDLTIPVVAGSTMILAGVAWVNRQKSAKPDPAP
ncbi:MAG: DMT family transporter [Rhodospirillales bacterium]